MDAKRLAVQREKEQHIKGENAETRSNGVHHEWNTSSLSVSLTSLRKEGPRPFTRTLLKEITTRFHHSMSQE
jgi:hypothetical protein